MSMRLFFLITLLAVSISATSLVATATTTLPCVVSQVQVANHPEVTQVSGGPQYVLAVTAMVTYSANPDCGHTTYDAVTGISAFHPTYIVERRDAKTGSYEAIRSFVPAIFNDGSGRPRRSTVLEISLPQGSYRIRSFAGSNLMESLPFAVGSTAGDFAPILPFEKPIPVDDRFKLAYGQPSAIVRSGAIYFRAFNPDIKPAAGYLYQDQPDGTTSIVPVTFEQLDASDNGFYGVLTTGGDFLQMRVRLSQVGIGTFDGGLPIVGCITTSGGNACFNVFDPAVPFKDFNLNAAPFGGVIGR